jgi:N-acetylglucosamine kinase-like BadF-type ATPase
MIAVVYSGSRHADWKLAEKGIIVSELKTPGINPFFSNESHIVQLLDKSVELINNAEKINRVYFFGAGASSKERQDIITNALGSFFRFSKIIVEHDLKAAAIAACGDEKGVVGILGSGSNAAYFDGKKISDNNFGLGYILGDEGSANWLGRRLLKSFLNDLMPLDFAEKFKKKYDLDRTQILDKVYRQAEPALYLSSFVDFLMDNQNHPFVKKLVSEGFDLYFKTYIKPLKEINPESSIHMLGTVAAGFEEYLVEVASNNNLEISSIIKEPIYNLLKYYANKN